VQHPWAGVAIVFFLKSCHCTAFATSSVIVEVELPSFVLCLRHVDLLRHFIDFTALL
ncbi:hypothetical protein LINGRAHAP2_LOCUS7939, partial [Linum grandiflorum]